MEVRATNQRPETGNRRPESMKITREEIMHVANLARLEMDDESVEKFAIQIDEILRYVEILNNVDTNGVQPTSHAIFLTNAFRNDEERQDVVREVLLENAPEKENGSFIVPKVVG
jgi:aspartyl-tRNA(Asn)/glutamyl-tRNA(Gln) amidotransferase subunit C